MRVNDGIMVCGEVLAREIKTKMRLALEIANMQPHGERLRHMDVDEKSEEVQGISIRMRQLKAKCSTLHTFTDF